MDIPDAVYREFKVNTTLNGESMRNATLAFMVAYNTAGRNPLPSAKTEEENYEESPTWAGIAEKFIKKYPKEPLDNEKMRDEIVSARRKGLA